MSLIGFADVLEKSPGCKCPFLLIQPPSGMGVIGKHETSKDGDTDGDNSFLYAFSAHVLSSWISSLGDTYDDEEPAPAFNAVGAIQVTEDRCAEEAAEHIGERVA